MLGLDSNFWAAIAGALVGGIFSVGLQALATRQTQRERFAAKKENDRALAYSLAFKLVKITNRLGNIKKHVDECKYDVLEENPMPLSWSYLRPILNLPDEVNLNPNEMALLFSLKNDELFNMVLNIEPVYNSILPAWREYRQFRDQFTSIAEQKLDVTTGVSEASIDISSHNGIILFEINMLADNLIDRALRDFCEAEKVLSSAVAVLNLALQLGISTDSSQGSTGAT